MDYYQPENNRHALYKLLTERRSILQSLLNDIRKKPVIPPKGMLRVTKCRKNSQYYWKERAEDTWRYLPKSRIDEARVFVNSEYRNAIANQASMQLRVINRLLSASVFNSLESYYDKLCDGRKALVQRFTPGKEDVVKSFLDETYSTFDLYENTTHKTSNGEFVRSKAEWMIAERLYRNKIPYQYEYPMTLPDYGMTRPDFRCLNVRTREIILWEHLGRMGESDYASNALIKINAYEKNGYFPGERLILTFETSDVALTSEVIDRWINRLLV